MRDSSTARNVWKCPLCPQTYNRKGALVCHMKHKHQARQDVICAVCGKALSSKAAYNLHMATHTGMYKYQCDLCNKGFVLKQDLVAHVNRHNGIRPYVCEVCRAGFYHKRNLSRHTRERHQNIPMPTNVETRASTRVSTQRMV